jgi:hypothetical protein
LSRAHVAPGIGESVLSWRREAGENGVIGAHLMAIKTVQLSLKIDGENAITRVFPGMPELQMPYLFARLSAE